MAYGITFQETMEGWFALDEIDPQAGVRKGCTEGTRLTMHASITIKNIDQFIADETHAGKLCGTIDFPPVGNDLKATAGVFNLFSPAGEPGLKYMIYGLSFEHGGKQRYLSGKKYVRNEPEFDLWVDTTTLYTKLHDGPDADAAVIGVGVLRLDLVDFMKIISTLRVTGVKSASGKAKAIAKFGQFFMGELWDTYGPGN